MRRDPTEPRSERFGWVLAAVSFLTWGCGQQDGGAPHASERSWVPSDGAYRLWYLAPPWRLGSMTDQQAVLEVGTDWLSSFVSAEPGKRVWLTQLTVSVMSGQTPAAFVAGWISGATARGATVTYASRQVALGGGVSGIEAADRIGPGSERLVAAQLGDGRTVVLSFRSFVDVSADSDVTHMIATFEPRPPVDVDR